MASVKPNTYYVTIYSNALFDLSRHTTDGDTWVSILGYVIDVGKNWFKIHRGRDITSRMLMQFHDIPMDINDDR